MPLLLALAVAGGADGPRRCCAGRWTGGATCWPTSLSASGRGRGAMGRLLQAYRPDLVAGERRLPARDAGRRRGLRQRQPGLGVPRPRRRRCRRRPVRLDVTVDGNAGRRPTWRRPTASCCRGRVPSRIAPRGWRAAPGLVGRGGGAWRAKGRPFLGICVGMQLMAERGLEHGDHTRASGGSRARSRPMPAPRACGCRRWAGTRWTFDAGRPPAAPRAVSPATHAYFVHSATRCGPAAPPTCWRRHGVRRARSRPWSRTWQPRRHPVPCGEKPGGGASASSANFLRWAP